TPLPNRLFRNVSEPGGPLRFVDITESSGAGETGYGVGTCFGDVDNDGWTDIYVTNLDQDALLRNLGADESGQVRFENTTAVAGIDSPRFGSSCAFADYDRDGCLDLFVVNFVDFTLENNLRCGTEEVPAYCSPDVYDGLPDQLYRGRCDGTFEDVSDAAGVANRDPEQSKGLGALWTDFDDDGDLDLYVANDSTRNFLYRNGGDGRFEDVAIYAGAAFNDRGETEASMGVDAGDFDGDGRLDLFMTHLDFESNTLYRNTGNSLYLDSSAVSGLATPSATRVGFGTNFFDFDHDGDADVFVANGHILDNAGLRNPMLSYEQPNQLYENVGGRFVDASGRAGPHFARLRVGRASATG
ncbi:MAG: VCBS repeat-containing protein, partial [Acidobacteriota bacterium]